MSLVHRAVGVAPDPNDIVGLLCMSEADKRVQAQKALDWYLASTYDLISRRDVDRPPSSIWADEEYAHRLSIAAKCARELHVLASRLVQCLLRCTNTSATALEPTTKEQAPSQTTLRRRKPASEIQSTKQTQENDSKPETTASTHTDHAPITPYLTLPAVQPLPPKELDAFFKAHFESEEQVVREATLQLHVLLHMTEMLHDRVMYPSDFHLTAIEQPHADDDNVRVKLSVNAKILHDIIIDLLKEHDDVSDSTARIMCGLMCHAASRLFRTDVAGMEAYQRLIETSYNN